VTLVQEKEEQERRTLMESVLKVLAIEALEREVGGFESIRVVIG
jgi:hypothetical protein